LGSDTEGTAEFALAVACCRWPPSPGHDGALRAAAAAVDWSVFVGIARRHRIEALAWASLRRAGVDVPAEAGRALAAAARDIAGRNLHAAAESARLRRDFDAAGIPLLFIKGLTLGRLAYGAPQLKMSWDIDLLIDRPRLAEAAARLEAAGYALSIPPVARRDRLEAWHDGSKESVWHAAGRGTWVELHTRLVDNARLLRGVGMPARPREVEVAKGISLPTLGRDELFAYLCVHGASSAWFRLKWIADLAALIGGCDAGEIDRLYRSSQALGAGRAAGQALLLCRALFGTDLGDGLARRLESDRTSAWMCRAALAQMSGRFALTEPTARRFGTLAIHLTQFGLLPGLAFKLSEGWRQFGAVRRGDG
jgi:hypothetical protein